MEREREAQSIGREQPISDKEEIVDDNRLERRDAQELGAAIPSIVLELSFKPSWESQIFPAFPNEAFYGCKGDRWMCHDAPFYPPESLINDLTSP